MKKLRKYYTLKNLLRGLVIGTGLAIVFVASGVVSGALGVLGVMLVFVLITPAVIQNGPSEKVEIEE